MPDVLTCIFSYNRQPYLRNTVDSFHEYFRIGDLMVMDDGSDDEELVEYLNQLSNSGVLVIRKGRTHPDQLHGGLYSLLNDAIEYAMENGYELLNLVQDDMQFLWHDPDILSKVWMIFDLKKDVFQVQNVFHKKITKYMLIDQDRIEFHPDSNSYHARPYGVCDLGFLNLQTVEEIGFRFGDSEGDTGDLWYNKGYRLHALHSPNLAYIPWPTNFYGNKTRRRLPVPFLRAPRKPPRKYYLTPIGPGQVLQLQERSLKMLPFLEDYSRPWGWRCIYPGWYTQFFTRTTVKEYAQLLTRYWMHGERIIPRPVTGGPKS